MINAAILLLVFCKISFNKTVPDFIGGLAISATYFVITMASPNLVVSGTNPAVILPLSYFKQDQSYNWLALIGGLIGSVIGVTIHNMSEADSEILKKAIIKADQEIFGEEKANFEPAQQIEMKERNRSGNKFTVYEKEELRED